jgi:hypothetical protein
VGALERSSERRNPPPAMVRTLPFRLSPVDGEALDSYLEALAHRMQAPWAGIVDAVGLADSPRSVSGSVYQWLADPSPPQVATISTATGLEPKVVESMTGQRFTRAPPHDLAGVRLWLSPVRSRFCPRCLASGGGRWPLWWRLRWAFACPVHECLLSDDCPECGRWQRVGPLPRDFVPAPGKCARKALGAGRRHLLRCGADLCTAEMTGNVTVSAQMVDLQSRLLGVIEHRQLTEGLYAASAVPASQFLIDLAAVGGRVLTYAAPTDLGGRVAAPLLEAYLHTLTQSGRPGRRAMALADSAAATAVAAAGAMEALAQPTVSAAGDRLRWLIAGTRSRGLSVNTSNVGWGNHVSPVLISIQLAALRPYLGPTARLRYRIDSPNPRRPDINSDRARHVPATVWPNIGLRFASDGIGYEQIGTAMSAVLVIVGTRVSLSDAVSRLGGATTAGAVSRVLGHLCARPLWSGMASTLRHLADHLDAEGSPIDYRLRRTLPFDEFLPLEQWHMICRHTGIPVGAQLRLRLVRCWMYARITGSPARQCGDSLASRQWFRVQLANLPALLTAELVNRLDDVARQFLAAHGRAHEPLTWRPQPLHDESLPTDS